MMLKPFDDVVFSMEKGQLAYLKTIFGHQIVFLRDNKIQNGKAKVLVSHILLRIPDTFRGFFIDGKKNGYWEYFENNNKVKEEFYRENKLITSKMLK